jgi:catechol 2,3-dioxygenase-like lactoylglutathione lyase family enzyme
VIDLDHVAIGLRDISDSLAVLVGELGAEELFGGAEIGFRAMQVQCGPMRVELLEPHNVEVSDFLVRFLERTGEGPHHITFKTDDIVRLLERVEGAGYRPVGVNIDNPYWKEAFLHPSQAGGTVVQLAQSAADISEIRERLAEMADGGSLGEWGPHRWWEEPPPRAEERADLLRVVLGTKDLDRTLALFRDLLEGEVASSAEGTDITWPGGTIRAVDGPAGIEALEWSHDGPEHERTVGGALFRLSSRRQEDSTAR